MYGICGLLEDFRFDGTKEIIDGGGYSDGNTGKEGFWFKECALECLEIPLVSLPNITLFFTLSTEGIF